MTAPSGQSSPIGFSPSSLRFDGLNPAPIGLRGQAEGLELLPCRLGPDARPPGPAAPVPDTLAPRASVPGLSGLLCGRRPHRRCARARLPSPHAPQRRTHRPQQPADIGVRLRAASRDRDSPCPDRRHQRRAHAAPAVPKRRFDLVHHSSCLTERNRIDSPRDSLQGIRLCRSVRILVDSRVRCASWLAPVRSSSCASLCLDAV